jgi:PTS system fructose-specific IIB component/fructose-specific PTS system IIB-like component
MKILAITACPTGIAHTYMAAEQLERTGKQLGHTIKVETQGAMGIENRLTEADVLGADALILASDLPVQGRERFAGIAKIVEVPVQQAIKNPAEIFARLL